MNMKKKLLAIVCGLTTILFACVNRTPNLHQAYEGFCESKGQNYYKFVDTMFVVKPVKCMDKDGVIHKYNVEVIDGKAHEVIKHEQGMSQV